MIAQALTPKSRKTTSAGGKPSGAFAKITVEGEHNRVSIAKSERKASVIEKRRSVALNKVNAVDLEGWIQTRKGAGGEWRMPSSRFRFYWEVFNFILYTTNAFLIPSRIVFGSRGSVESEWITAVALFIQCVFLVDFGKCGGMERLKFVAAVATMPLSQQG